LKQAWPSADKVPLQRSLFYDLFTNLMNALVVAVLSE